MTNPSSKEYLGRAPAVKAMLAGSTAKHIASDRPAPERPKSLADEAVRVLAEVAWTVEEGQGFEAATVVHQDLELSVGLPRWRWLDAPVLNPDPRDRQTVLATVQCIPFDLSRGAPESLLAAAAPSSRRSTMPTSARPATAPLPCANRCSSSGRREL